MTNGTGSARKPSLLDAIYSPCVLDLSITVSHASVKLAFRALRQISFPHYVRRPSKWISFSLRLFEPRARLLVLLRLWHFGQPWSLLCTDSGAGPASRAAHCATARGSSGTRSRRFCARGRLWSLQSGTSSSGRASPRRWRGIERVSQHVETQAFLRVPGHSKLSSPHEICTQGSGTLSGLGHAKPRCCGCGRWSSRHLSREKGFAATLARR